MPKGSNNTSATSQAQGSPPCYAAIDLGTNNCRMLVARPDGVTNRDGLLVIDGYSRIVRLGEGLAASGRLSEEAIDRTIKALKICAGKIRNHGVMDTRATATEAWPRNSARTPWRQTPLRSSSRASPRP